MPDEPDRVGPFTIWLRSNADVALVQGGKGDLDLEEPLATPTGWTTVGDVEIGNRLFDETGNICKVLAKSEVMFHDAYKVVFSDGSIIRAGGDHEWQLERWMYDSGKKGSRRVPLKLKTRDMVGKCNHVYPSKRQNNLIYSIPNTLPLNLPDARLPLDPYLFGLWLGDGSTSSPILTASEEDMEHYEKYLQKIGLSFKRLLQKEKHSPQIYVRGIRRILRKKLSVWGHKFIPQAYLRASTSQRLALLQGLMDTDGGVETSQKKHRAEFYNSNPTLVEQTKELIISLGMKVTECIRVRKSSFGGSSQPAYRLRFTPVLPVFHLQRKLAKLETISSEKGTTRRFITDVIPDGVGLTQCITVSSPSHLFLAGRAMIPTRNSGKSDALIAHNLRPEYLTSSRFLGVIFRREYKRLTELIDRAREWLSRTGMRWQWQGDLSRIMFESGARLAFHNVEHEEDVRKYQGWEIASLCIDQLDEFCLTPDHEVLTENGWRKINSVQPSTDRVLSLHEDRTMSYETVTAVPAFEYDGMLYEYFAKNGTAFHGTPNHKLVIERSGVNIYHRQKYEKDDRGWELRAIKDLPVETIQVRSGIPSGNPPGDVTLPILNGRGFNRNQNQSPIFPANDYFEFMGGYLSEGCAYQNPDNERSRRYGKAPRIQIAQTKPQESLNALMERVPYKVTRSWDKEAYLIFSRQLFEHLKPLGNSYAKRIPRWMMNSSPDQLRLLLNSFVAGDGYVGKTGGITIGLANEGLIDDLQEICVRLGMVATKGHSWIFLPKYNKRYECWVLSIHSLNHHNTGHALYKSKIKEVPYKGMVYCLSVPPYHTFLVRYRGRTFWSGNSEPSFNFLLLQNRSGDPKIKATCRANANPGGIGHCVREGDVLTPHGWVPIQQIAIGDMVATLDSDERLIYVPVLQKHEYDFTGGLFLFKNITARIECTPEHKIARRTETKRPNGRTWNPISLIAVNKLSKDTRFIRAAKHWRGEKIRTFTIPCEEKRQARKPQPLSLSGDDYCELMGWFLSEGYTIQRKIRGDVGVGISQSKSENRRKIGSLLQRIGIDARINDMTFTWWSRSWWKYLSQFGKCRDKFVPDEIKRATKTQLQIFWQSAMSGDGHGSHYYTISERLANDMQEIGLKLGYSPRISSRPRPNRDGLSYDINFREPRDGWLDKSLCTSVPYEGPVYCIGVPNHKFFIRQGGAIWLSGNCWVKRRFIDGFEPGKKYTIKTVIDGVEYTQTYLNVFATVFDNPRYRNDKAYIAKLATEKNPVLRKALFEGDWNIVTGQFFTEFATQIHVIPSRGLPNEWKRLGGMDYGNYKVLEILCEDHLGNIYVEYECAYEPNPHGERLLTASEYGDMTAKFMIDRKICGGVPEGKREDYILMPRVIGDVNMWSATGRDVGSKRTAVEIIQDIWNEQFRRAELVAPRILPVSKRRTEEYQYRIACWDGIRDYLHYEYDEVGENLKIEPRLLFMDRCRGIIETLPSLQGDPNDPRDIAPKQIDHYVDALKMPLMEIRRPVPRPLVKEIRTLDDEMQQFFYQLHTRGTNRRVWTSV